MSIHFRYQILPKIVAWVILIVFLTASFIVFAMVRKNLENTGLNDLKNKTQLVQQLINDNFVTFAVRQPRAIRALFDASDYVTGNEFHAFFVSRDVLTNFPGISYVGFSRYIKNTDSAKQSLIKELQPQNYDGLKNFKIYPQTQNDFAAPLVYIEPVESSVATIGFDALSESSRAKAISQAIDSGDFVLSDKVTVHPSETRGFVGYLPVYNKNITASSTTEEKRSNVYGVVSTVFEVDSLFGNFDKSITSLEFNNLDIEVYECIDTSQNGLLYDYDSGTKIFNMADSAAKTETRLVLGGHVFTLVVADLGGLIAPESRSVPYVDLSAGIVISLLLFAAFYLLSIKYEHARILAEKMTLDLRRSEEEYKKQNKNLNDAKIGMLNLLKDLNREKDNLEKEKVKAETILKSIGDGVVATDEFGNVLIINDVARKKLGFSDSDKLIGKNISDLWSVQDETGNKLPEEQRPIYQSIKKLEKVSSSIFHPYYYVRKDGSRFPVAIAATPVILNGKLMGMTVVFRDIAREREIDRAKTEFVSLASHQLRTPLTAMKWKTEILLSSKYGKLNEKQKKALADIYNSNESLIALVNDLLNVSKVEFGSLSVNFKKVDLIGITDKIVKSFILLGASKKQTLIFNKPDSLPQTEIDPVLYTQALQNLISNAINYGNENTDIIVSLVLDEQDGRIVVSVKNHGLPISLADQEKLFTRFYRAENARKMYTHGSGLGLYIVKAAVEANGGKVSVFSDEKQTVFSFTIPLKRPDAANHNGSNL